MDIKKTRKINGRKEKLSLQHKKKHLKTRPLIQGIEGKFPEDTKSSAYDPLCLTIDVMARLTVSLPETQIKNILCATNEHTTCMQVEQQQIDVIEIANRTVT